MNMNVYMHSYHMLFTTFASVLYRIYNLSLAFGSSLYIRYNTVAHVVNSTYTMTIKTGFKIEAGILTVLAGDF